MMLAIINCGIGIKYAENAVSAEKGVGVVAGVVGLSYIAVLIWWYVKGKKSSTPVEATLPESDSLGYVDK
jgi:hypothetical protein